MCYNIFVAGINHFHQTPDREWFETDAVLRVSLGNFLFFSILSLLMIGVKNQKDPRDSLHHGGWMMKVICWCLLVIFMFFLPNEIVSFYGKPNFTFSMYSFQQVKLTSFMFAAESTSKFGSGLFLLVQVVLLLDFVHSWNDTWVGYDEQFWLVLFVFTFHKQLKFNSSLIFIQFFFLIINHVMDAGIQPCLWFPSCVT